MAWSAPLDTLAQWSATDQQILYAACYRLLENSGIDATGLFSTEMFTPAQFLAALNNRQRQFLDETGAIVTRVWQNSTPQQIRYALPPDWIATRRFTYKNLDGQQYALFRADTYMLDQGQSSWMYNFSLPAMFSESALPTLEVELANPPNDVGMMGLNYTAQPPTLDETGVKLAVPDEFAPALLYGALADLLSSDGAGKDLARAQYCQMRYQQGVELARLLMEGV